MKNETKASSPPKKKQNQQLKAKKKTHLYGKKDEKKYYKGTLYTNDDLPLPKFSRREWGHGSDNDLDAHEYVGAARFCFEPWAIKEWSLRKRARKLLDKVMRSAKRLDCRVDMRREIISTRHKID